MTDKEELAYAEGTRRLAIDMLGLILSEMYLEDKEMVVLIRERQEAIQALRLLCEDFGDNDWPDELHLRDVIEKHLGRHLEST